MIDRPTFLNGHFELIDGCLPIERCKKHQKMTTSPFVFFRGSSQLFYADIANEVLNLPNRRWPLTTIMGDCHTSNFGFFTEEGSHGDKVIFAANDFDDACIGDPLWDILRYLVSLELCVEHCKLLSQNKIVSEHKYIGQPWIDEGGTQEAKSAFIGAYINTCLGVVGDANYILNIFDEFEGSHIFKKRYNKAKKRASGGSQFDSKSSLAKAVVVTKNGLRFDLGNPKFKQLKLPIYDELYRTFLPYMNDEILDIVERIDSGTGSVDLQRYYFLVGPNRHCSSQAMSLSHIVELKQQRNAAPLYYFPDLSPRNRLDPAHLTFRCQRQMQRSPDMLLDEVKWRDAHWLIRSRHHAKVGFDPEHIGLGLENKERGFAHYAKACGTDLALSHSRGDRRSNEFPLGMADNLPSVSNYLIEIASSYALQVIEDWEWMRGEFQ